MVQGFDLKPLTACSCGIHKEKTPKPKLRNATHRMKREGGKEFEQLCKTNVIKACFQ